MGCPSFISKRVQSLVSPISAVSVEWGIFEFGFLKTFLVIFCFLTILYVLFVIGYIGANSMRIRCEICPAVSVSLIYNKTKMVYFYYKS